MADEAVIRIIVEGSRGGGGGLGGGGAPGRPSTPSPGAAPIFAPARGNSYARYSAGAQARMSDDPVLNVIGQFGGVFGKLFDALLAVVVRAKQFTDTQLPTIKFPIPPPPYQPPPPPMSPGFFPAGGSYGAFAAQGPPAPPMPPSYPVGGSYAQFNPGATTTTQPAKAAHLFPQAGSFGQFSPPPVVQPIFPQAGSFGQLNPKPPVPAPGILSNLGGMAAAALGPVAVAIAVVKALEVFKDMLTGSIQALGQFGANLISPDNDPSHFVKTLGDATQGVADKFFILSPLLGIFGSTIGATIGVLGDFMRQIDGMVDRYAAYSPLLAQGQAMAEITNVLGDMRRSQMVGPELLEYIQARSQLQQRVEDIKIDLLKQVVPVVVQLLPLLELMVAGIGAGANEVGAILAIGNAFIQPHLDVLRQLARWLGAQDQGADFGNLVMPTEALIRGFPFSGLNMRERV